MNDFIRNLLFLPEQASTFAEKVDSLHYFVVGVTMLMSLGVGTAAIIFFFRYRQRSSMLNLARGEHGMLGPLACRMAPPTARWSAGVTRPSSIPPYAYTGAFRCDAHQDYLATAHDLKH